MMPQALPPRGPGPIAVAALTSPPHRGSVVDWHWLVLVALPLVTLWINPSWALNPSMQIDAWVYYGYQRDLSLYLTHWFPSLYYGTRLPLILPGWLAYQLAEPMVAHVATHLLFYWVALFSFYVIVAHVIDRRVALLGAVLLGGNKMFLSAFGWDYTDGPLNAYYLLSLALLTLAARRDRPLGLMLGAGAAYAGMLFINPMPVLFSLTFPAFYIWRDIARTGRFRILATIRAALVFAFGGGLLTLTLCIANVLLGGDFWFYGPSIEFARSQANAPNPWRDSGFHWYHWPTTHPFLALGVVAALAYLTTWILRRFREPDAPALFFSVNYLYTAGLWVGLELRGNPVLQFPFYFNLLLPALFLCLTACLLHPPARRTWWIPALLAPALAALLIAQNGPRSYEVNYWAAGLLGLATPIPLRDGLLAACAALLIWRVVAARSRLAWGVSLACVGVLSAFQGPAHDAWFGGDLRPLFRNVAAARLVINDAAAGNTRRPRLWYDDRGPMNHTLVALSSTYLYEYSRLGFQWPALSAADVAHAQLTAETNGFVLSAEPEVQAAARRALAPHGWTADVVRQTRIENAGAGFWISQLRFAERPGTPVAVTRHSADEPALLYVLPAETPLAMARAALDPWREVGGVDGVRLERGERGVRITTAAGRWSYTAIHPPLIAAEDGTYLFRVRIRDLSGGLCFGLQDEARTKWLVQAAPTAQTDGSWVHTLRIELRAGEAVQPLISNNHPSTDAVSTFTLERMDVFLAPAAEPDSATN